jgi:uncharacterized protein (DUF486 family)
MKPGFWHFLLGLISIVIGSTLWVRAEKANSILNIDVFISMGIVAFGGLNIIAGIVDVAALLQQKAFNPGTQVNMLQKLFIFALIFIGTVAYTIASYYHLKYKDWTFLKALLIAVPFVLIEYQFSLRGNYLAHNLLRMNAVQIILITMVFYFVNAWIMNYFVLKHEVVAWRELLAFLCIICAFWLTTSF